MSVASLLDAHLEQIAACAQTIAELNFPRAKIFSNALLQPHDITTLIRDTEAHERALFTVPQEPKQSRRSTVFPANGTNPLLGGPQGALRAPRRNTAVAAVLGGDLVERIRRGGGAGSGSALGNGPSRERGDVDVDVLLEGAEKLCSVYPIPGANARIATLRQRNSRLASSIAYYEARAAEQAEQLKRLNKSDDLAGTVDEEGAADEIYTAEDLKRVEDDIKELERKKQALEERVSCMEKDLNFR